MTIVLSFGIRFFFWNANKAFVRMRLLAAYVTKSKPDWGGPHMCQRSLDRLAEYVNDGLLQTVVDQVMSQTRARESQNWSAHI